MLKNIILLGLFCICGAISAQIKSPEEFLNNRYTQYFTPHHQLVAYIQYLAANSDLIQIEEIGRTYEDRPMYLCYISTPLNLSRKEEIRQTHLYHIGLSATKPAQSIDKVITWLSYSVHGNEAAGSEASMRVMHRLLSRTDDQVKSWLENSLIIINPSLNPDGYNRYSQWHNGHTSRIPNPSRLDIEHNEAWPTGRVNHYMFDLNRDWAWQTQKESRQHIAAYQRWMPHIHADVHEMGYNNHYYFAPAAEPHHKFITPHQKNFQMTIGKTNAGYFDERGWLYFTREIYDLFYPSYGDTYPTYNGAIGMTYEKAGIRAGRSVETTNGDTLTLAQRIEEHTTTSLATIEVAANNHQLLVQEFRKFFSDAKQKPKGKFQSYVLKQHPRLDQLQDLLTRNGIEYAYAAEARKVAGFHYTSAIHKEFEIQTGDMIIHADQPRSVLTQVLMEYESELSDSNTYDITAWSVPLAYNLECYGMTTKINLKSTAQRIKQVSKSPSDQVYAAYFPWKSMAAPGLVARLHQKGYVMRMALKNVTFEEGDIEAGTIVISRGDNPRRMFDKEIPELLMGYEGAGYLKSGLSVSGGDLGGNAFVLLQKPRVLTLTGEGTSNNEAGQIWHYFDETLQYPLTLCEVDRLERADLTQFNTIILPDGEYHLDDEVVRKLKAWVQGGGKLLVMGGALTLFTDREGWALNAYATAEEKDNAKKDRENKVLSARKDHFHDLDRKGLSQYISGALIENKLDPTHPLTFGLNQPYYSLKTGNQTYKLLKNTLNPIYVPQSYKHLGFVGAAVKPALHESVSYAVESMGSGNVVYMVDNPLFRGFWEAGKLLFSNALFLIE